MSVVALVRRKFSMWKQRSFNRFAYFINFLALFGIVHFRWNPKRRVFERERRRTLVRIHLTRAVSSGLYFIYLLCRLFQQTILYHVKLGNLILLLLWLNLYALVFNMSLNTLVHSSEIVQSWNRFDALNRNWCRGKGNIMCFI